MRKRIIVGAILAAAWLAGTACTTHQQSAPNLSGPSELALALSISATPDLLALDGSQSAVVVAAKGPNGEPRVGLSLRLDIAVGNTIQDCGQLSSRNVVTGQDGRAVSVFTAPSLPLPFPNCLNFAPGGSVTIIATPTGSDAQTAAQRVAFIQMVPPGGVTIVPPAPTPVANFSVVPAAPAAGTPVVFNAATSCGGPLVNNACTSISQLVSYAWSFGDGTSTTVTTPTVSHTYFTQQVFAVTLTVTNDRGLSASVTLSVTVGSPTVSTTANFVFSPNPTAVNQPVVFDASTTVTAPGVTITDYAWVFGDGQGIVHTTNKTISHVYTIAGVFSVTLTVTDNIGSRTAATVKTTTITVGVVAGLPVASFTINPSPAQVAVAITVDGSASTKSPGAVNIVSWTWDFGDGTPSQTTVTATTTHTYLASGNYIITLTVTDNLGLQGSLQKLLVVQ